jgi:predicted transcriptional regulator
LQALAGKQAMPMRAAAREVNRDVKQVHCDVQALLRAGVLSKTDTGQIEFPYDSIHVDFVLRAA